MSRLSSFGPPARRITSRTPRTSSGTSSQPPARRITPTPGACFSRNTSKPPARRITHGAAQGAQEWTSKPPARRITPDSHEQCFLPTSKPPARRITSVSSGNIPVFQGIILKKIPKASFAASVSNVFLFQPFFRQRFSEPAVARKAVRAFPASGASGAPAGSGGGP